MKLISKILFSMFFMLITTSCSDNKTPQDVQKARTREQINQRLAYIKPLIGEYEGFLLESRSKRKSQLQFNIILAGEPYNPGIPDETTAPTLAGSMNWYVSDGSGIYVPVSFTRSDYDASSGRINFYSDNKESSLIAVFDPQSNKLTGSWFNSSRGTIGDFDLTKLPQ